MVNLDEGRFEELPCRESEDAILNTTGSHSIGTQPGFVPRPDSLGAVRANPSDELVQAVQTVASKKEAWARLGVDEKIALLDATRKDV